MIFDSFVSPSDALVNEGKAGTIGKILGKFCYPLEKHLLHYADLLLVDTQLHKEFFNQQFNIPLEKIKTIYVGANEKFSSPECSLSNDNHMQILFYGSCLPLHGLDVILGAIKKLKACPVKVILIGGNKIAAQTINKFIKTNKLSNIEHIKWVSFSKLCEYYIARSELILGGPFGGTPQAQRVITGKTFQSLAMGKATIIGKIDEDTGFQHRKNCLLVKQNDVQDLADVIFWCSQNRDKLHSIGLNGKKLFFQRYSLAKISAKLTGILTQKNEYSI